MGMRFIFVGVLLILVVALSAVSFTPEQESVNIPSTSKNTVQKVVPIAEEKKEAPKPTSQPDFVQEFERIVAQFEAEDEKDKFEKKELDSPYDHIPMRDIKVYKNQVVITINNPQWAMYTDTNSMDPVIDETSNAIQIVPTSPDQIHVGDIVAYKSKYAEGTITHRVIEIGEDALGWYAILKGDNNPSKDPGKVRFDQVQRVVVAIIY